MTPFAKPVEVGEGEAKWTGNMGEVGLGWA